MDSNETRLATTGIIWVAFTVVMVSAMAASANMSGGLLIMLVMIFTIAALAGTNLIWKYSAAQNVAEKVKRHSRVDRVLDNMSDQELEELRSRLAGSADDETVSLEDLLVRHRPGFDTGTKGTS